MLTPVDNSGHGVSASHSQSVDLRISHESAPFVTSDEASSLSRLRVLIHSDQVSVHENINGRLGSDGKIATDDQRSLGHHPKGEVGLLLLVGKTTVADLEHVRIVPGTRATPFEMPLTLLEVILD